MREATCRRGLTSSAPARPARCSRAAPTAAPSVAASRTGAPPARGAAAGPPASRSSSTSAPAPPAVNSFGTSSSSRLRHLAPPDQPAPGLRQRDPHQPAPAFLRAPGQRHHRAERHQVAGQVVDRRDRIELRTRRRAGEQLALAAGDAADRLHHGVEAAARGPRPDVAEGAQRDVDDAGPRAAPAPRARGRARRGCPAGSPARTRRPRGPARAASRRLRVWRRSRWADSLPWPVSYSW